MDLTERKSFLHTHHKDGYKSNNQRGNLQALCIGCHLTKPDHTHLRNLPDYRKFISYYRVGNNKSKSYADWNVPGSPLNINVSYFTEVFSGELSKGRKLNLIHLQKIVADKMGIKRFTLLRTEGFDEKPIREAYEKALLRYKETQES